MDNPKPLPRLIGQYEILRVTGRGGMAVVYLANDLKHQRQVAVKVLTQQVLDPADRARFDREIAIVARLQHPHVVPLFDSGEADGSLFYVMPFVEGETLRHRIDRDGPFAVDVAVRVAAQVAAALDYAHTQGVIHRDIKPSNILLSADIAMLADFGIARAVGPNTDATLTVTGVVGTPTYMSPEHADGSRSVGAPSDLYALGCVLYEMLAGTPLYSAPTAGGLMMQHCVAPIPSIRALRPDVPVAVDVVLQRMVAKQPDDRFPTAAAFRTALEAALTMEATGSRALSLADALPTSLGVRLRSRRVLAGASVAAVALAAWIAWEVSASGGGSVVFDQNTIAVAPFDVTDARDSLWKHGMVDVLSRNYDGAGPLRAVPPTTIIRAWRGRADGLSGLALARKTGAGFVVLGSMMRSGGERIRCSLALYDAMSETTVFSTEVPGELSAIDKVTDSMTVEVLRFLGRSRPIAALPRSTIGSRSLVALKAFLQGEQAYRRNDYATAQPLYEEAIARDSTFALANRRMRGITRRNDEWDSTSLAWATRAGGLNRGLSPRDSLLVLADSLAHLTSPYRPGGITEQSLAVIRRRMTVLQEAARRYPDDPEVWHDIGEMRLHDGMRIAGNSQELMLRAFERALLLDSAFAPSYFHAIELGANLRGPAVAARNARALLRLDSTNAFTRLAAALLEGNVSDAQLRAIGDSIPDAGTARFAGYLLRLWSDSAQSAARVYRYLLSRHDSGSVEERTTRNLLRLYLLRRGQLGTANRLSRGVDETGASFFLQVALHGRIPADSADRTIKGWIAEGRTDRLLLALPWFGQRKHIVSLSEIRVQCDRARAARVAGEAAQLQAAACVTLADAHIALARADSAAAARNFAQGADSVCGLTCSRSRLVGAALLRELGDLAASARILDRTPPPVSNGDTYDALWSLERARTADRLKDRDRALLEYRNVVRLWPAADPELSRYVEEARSALVRLDAPKT